ALRTPASALGRRSGAHRAAPAMERSRGCASANLKEAWKTEDMRLNTTRSKVASVAATVAVAALALTGCSGGNDSPSGEAGGTYPGQLTGAEGTLTIGDVGVTADALTVECSEDGGVITATLTEPESGNTVTTTQPEGGEGYAAATLTTSGSEIEFVPRDGVTSEDVEKLATESAEDVPPIFENEDQYGSPIEWASDGTADFYMGLHQEAEGESPVEVDVPGGTLDCSNNAAE